MKRILLFAIALTLGAAVSAQEATNESLEDRMTKNEKRTARLEKLKQYASLSGFIQAEYDWLDDGTNGNTTSSSSFYIRRLRFTIAGDLYKGKAGKLD